MYRERKLGNLNGFTGGNFAYNVYDKNMLCPALSTMQGGGREPMIVEDLRQIAQQIMAERGGLRIVEKEKINKVGQISNEGSQCGTVVSDEGLSPTLSAGTHGYANAHVCTEYRIRKLTERECFRLMGFKDSDFEKARAVNSATQIYKQAGNSIIRQVLIAIFLQLNIQGIKNWNDRTKEEREEFYKW